MEYYDLLLAKKLANGGSSTTVEELSVTENGTYNAETGKAYNPVKVNVPSSGGFDYVIVEQTVEITGGNLPTINVDDDDLQDSDAVVIKIIGNLGGGSLREYTTGRYWSSSPSSIRSSLYIGGYVFEIIIEKVGDGIYSFDVQLNGSSYPATYTITTAKIPF